MAQEDYASYESRLYTFRFYPSTTVSVSRLARAGFIYNGHNDEVYCPFCKLTLSQLPPRCQPLALHRAYAGSKCEFLIRNNQRVQPSQSASQPEEQQVRNDENITVLLLADSDEPTDHVVRRRYKLLCSVRNEVSSDERQEITSLPDYSALSPEQQSLNSEAFRRLTFRGHWNYSNIPSAEEMAAAAMVYIGPEDRVRCVYCHGELSSWSEGSSAMAEHREKFGYCRFVLGHEAVENIPIITDLESKLSPWLQSEENSDADEVNRLELGIITERVKYPELAIRSKRDVTFQTWPNTARRSAEELSNMHFFYTGVKDTVVCYSCGAEMSNLSPDEDLWLRHARLNPDCGQLLQDRGRAFVNDVISEFGRIEAPRTMDIGARVTTMDTGARNVASSRIGPRLDYPSTQHVRSLGYPREIIRSVLADRLRVDSDDHSTVPQLVGWIINRPTGFTDSVQEEPLRLPVVKRHAEKREEQTAAAPTVNEATTHPESARVQQSTDPADITALATEQKQQLLCKVCMDAPVGIVFLPCAHLVCCPLCASAMTHCPLCRRAVGSTVRAVL